MIAADVSPTLDRCGHLVTGAEDAAAALFDAGPDTVPWGSSFGELASSGGFEPIGAGARTPTQHRG